MAGERPLTIDDLEGGMAEIVQSPPDNGVLQMIVRRPNCGEREMVAQAELDEQVGLVGDNWSIRGSRHTPDGSAHPAQQVTVMNARAIALIAQQRDRWSLAGDQLYVDLDLSVTNLPPGSQLAIGTAVIEITAEPHTGCRHFTARFGADATRFVNSRAGKQLRLRGANAKIVQGGIVRVGDLARKIQT